MKKIIIYSTVLLLAACSVKTIPLKGKYQSETYYQNTSSSVDKVWDKLVDLFAKRGLSIKVIDRSSGLIVSDKYKLTYTFEDKTGKLLDPTAFVVLPKKIIPGSNTVFSPGYITGEWNVRIKDDGKGGTVINVNLVNINDVSTSLRGGSTESLSEAISTGVFETYIYNTIK